MLPPRARLALALGPGLLLAGLACWSFWGYSYDDAFITYRYALRWAEGEGLSYNPGEPVLGTTAPGYALALGALERLLPLGIPGWGTLLSLAGLLAPVTLAAVTLRHRPVTTAVAFPALAGVVLLSLRFNLELLGAETLAILGLVCAALYAAFGRAAPVAAGLLLALAMIFRLDAALAAGSLGLVLWWHRRRFPVRLAVAGLVPLALFLLWLHLEFGAVVPNTLAAKRAEVPFAASGYAASEALWLRRSLGIPGSLAFLALALAGAGDLARRGLHRRPLAVAVALWVAVHELAYHLLEVPFAPWYHVSTVAALAALAVWGSLAAGGAVAAALERRRGGSPTARREWLQAVTATLLLAPILAPSAAYLARQWGRPPDPRFGIYAEIGRAVAATAPPDAEVAAVEIGVLGYFCRRPVLDLIGLVSPEVLVWQREGVLAERVARRRPRFLVDAPVFRQRMLGAILRQEGVARCYRESAAFAAPEYAGGRVRLLESTCVAEEEPSARRIRNEEKEQVSRSARAAPASADSVPSR